jgi:hypothetical protein
VISAKPSPLLRRLLGVATDGYLACRAAGFTSEEAARIVSGAFNDRLPPARPYPEPPEPRDTEPPP